MSQRRAPRAFASLLAGLKSLREWIEARIYQFLYHVRSMTIRDWVFLALFLSGPIASGVLIGVKMFSSYLPTGDDPGNWLKRINAFLGNTYPLWSENLLTYPPLFHAVAALISLICGDPVIGMKILAVIVFALIPVTSGLLVYKISNNKHTAIVASLIVSFLPMHYEMIWWGAYPNLLGMAMLPIGVYCIVRILQGNSSNRDLMYLIVSSLLIAFTHHITAVVFAAILAITCIALIILGMLSTRFGIASLVSINVIIAYIASLMRFGYMVSNPVSVPIDLYEKLLWAFKSPIIFYILIVSSIIGILFLVGAWMFFEAIVISAWIIAPLLIACSQYIGVGVDVGRLTLFLGVPTVLASTLIMPRLREIGRVFRAVGEGEEQSYEVEINLDKALPAILIITLLVMTPILAYSTNEVAFDYYDWYSRDYRSYSQEERLQLLGWIKANTNFDDVIVAGYHLGRWIEGYSGRRVLMDIPFTTIAVRDEFYRSLSAQAILYSNYEISNGYFMVDDQSPLAPTFCPVIKVSTEWGYDPIVYLDDSFVRFTFIRDGKEWVEAPFKSWLLDFDANDRGDLKTFSLSYQTMALRINKTLTMTPNTAYFTIRYDVKPVVEAELKDARISFFLAWGKTIKKFNATERGFRLSTESSEIIVEFDKEPSHIEAGIYEEFNQHRVFVVLPLKKDGDSFTITFRNPNPVSSYPQNWSISLEKALMDFKPRYVIVQKGHVFHKTRTWAPSYPAGQVMYIEDAFVRVSFVKAGAAWKEAPYKAEVMDEEVFEDGRKITYSTVALNIYKEIRGDGRDLVIRYAAEPKPGVKILGIELPLWQSWGTQVSRVNVDGARAMVVSSSGSILIEADENSKIEYGLDPEFKAPRILIAKKAVEESVEITVRIRPLNYLSLITYEYLQTTRPEMDEGDRLNIINEAVEFKPVYETENLIVYEINYPSTSIFP